MFEDHVDDLCRQSIDTARKRFRLGIGREELIRMQRRQARKYEAWYIRNVPRVCLKTLLKLDGESPRVAGRYFHMVEVSYFRIYSGR